MVICDDVSVTRKNYTRAAAYLCSPTRSTFPKKPVPVCHGCTLRNAVNEHNTFCCFFCGLAEIDRRNHRRRSGRWCSSSITVVTIVNGVNLSLQFKLLERRKDDSTINGKRPRESGNKSDNNYLQSQ